jgi:hypothetical protein
MVWIIVWPMPCLGNLILMFNVMQCPLVLMSGLIEWGYLQDPHAHDIIDKLMIDATIVSPFTFF